jgi:hypothetical protein
MSEKEYVLHESLSRCIVQVNCQFGLTASAYVAGVTPADVKWYNKPPAVGFLCRTTKTICVPSSAVQIDNKYLANNNRFPFVSNSVTAPTGVIPDTVTQVSTITVEVLDKCDKNDRQRTRNYTCSLKCIDPSGEVAIIEINDNDFNFKTSDVLEYTSNLCIANPLQDVYSYSKDTGFVKGVLSKNSYTAPNAEFQAEHILTNFQIPDGYSGLPVVTKDRLLVGVINKVNHGPSSDFLIYSLDAMLYATNCEFKREYKRKNKHRCNQYKDIKNRITEINDLIGNFKVLRKCYLGLLWKNVDYNTYTTTVDPATGVESVITSNGIITSVDKSYDVGVQIKTLAGNTTITYTVLPGLTPVVPFPALVNSQFLSILNPEDIIVKFGNKDESGIPGSSVPCRAPGLYTWVINPNEKVNIRYRTAASGFKTCTKIPDGKLTDLLPLALDEAWYLQTQVLASPPGAPVAVTFSSPL